MYVLVIHRISEPASFRQIGERPHPNRPVEMRLVHALPSQSGTLCVCLWETHSLELLRMYADSVYGRSSTNEYHQIGEAESLGLDLHPLPRTLKGMFPLPFYTEPRPAIGLEARDS